MTTTTARNVSPPPVQAVVSTVDALVTAFVGRPASARAPPPPAPSRGSAMAAAPAVAVVDSPSQSSTLHDDLDYIMGFGGDSRSERRAAPVERRVARIAEVAGTTTTTTTTTTRMTVEPRPPEATTTAMGSNSQLRPKKKMSVLDDLREKGFV